MGRRYTGKGVTVAVLDTGDGGDSMHTLEKISPAYRKKL